MSYPEIFTLIFLIWAIGIYFLYELYNHRKKKKPSLGWHKLKELFLISLIIEMFYFSFSATPIFINSFFAKDRLLSFCGMLFFIALYFTLQIPKDDKKEDKKQGTQPKKDQKQEQGKQEASTKKVSETNS